MLKLTRNVTQTIVIADCLQIKIDKIEGKKIDLEISFLPEGIEPEEERATAPLLKPEDSFPTECLSKEVGQKIYLAQNVAIHILEIGKTMTRLGIQAPDIYNISRGENYEVKKRSDTVLGTE